jgi:short-subunit dehydrogenase
LGEKRNGNENRKNRKFEEKIIVITGASSGIGRQAALDLVTQKTGPIILVARSSLKLLELKRTLQVVSEPEGVDIVAYACDISKRRCSENRNTNTRKIWVY